MWWLMAFGRLAAHRSPGFGGGLCIRSVTRRRLSGVADDLDPKASRFKPKDNLSILTAVVSFRLILNPSLEIKGEPDA
jgi:hypothetical protein